MTISFSALSVDRLTSIKNFQNDLNWSSTDTRSVPFQDHLQYSPSANQVKTLYPPLPSRTSVFQWYKKGASFGKPASALHLEPPKPLTWILTGINQTSTNPVSINQLQSNGPAFSIDQFEDNIIDAMEGKVIGYSYALNLNKQSAKADGVDFRRTNTNSTSYHSAYKRMNIASISKTITAVAVLQLLEKNGLSIDSPIGPWLPDDWDKGLGFNDQHMLTFEDLLTHKSGIKEAFNFWKDFDQDYKDSVSVKWDGLKTMVEYGVFLGDYGKQTYSNLNFALFRVIIPALWKASGENPGIGVLDELEASALYGNYVAYNILIPIGINQASCHNNFEADKARFYNIFDPNGSGAESGNWVLSCGSGGWYLSAHELANFMANIRYNNAILSPSMRTLMDEHMLGWSFNWSLNGDHGLYRAHAGALYFDDADFGDRREMQGCIMKFPIYVEAVLLVNSSHIDNTLPCTILRNAFDAAWIN